MQKTCITLKAQILLRLHTNMWLFSLAENLVHKICPSNVAE